MTINSLNLGLPTALTNNLKVNAFKNNIKPASVKIDPVTTRGTDVDGKDTGSRIPASVRGLVDTLHSIQDLLARDTDKQQLVSEARPLFAQLVSDFKALSRQLKNDPNASEFLEKLKDRIAAVGRKLYNDTVEQLQAENDNGDGGVTRIRVDDVVRFGGEVDGDINATRGRPVDIVA